jgi:hypothetical protein
LIDARTPHRGWHYAGLAHPADIFNNFYATAILDKTEPLAGAAEYERRWHEKLVQGRRRRMKFGGEYHFGTLELP